MHTTPSTRLSIKARSLVAGLPDDPPAISKPRCGTRTSMAAPRTVVNSTSRTPYECLELIQPVGIPPGRFAAFALPGRVGNTLRWPDGRVTDLAGAEVGAAC